MKVLMANHRVYPFQGCGGNEKYPYFLAKSLLKNGVEVKIITSCDKKPKGKEISAFYEDIEFVFIPPETYSSSFVGIRKQLFNANLAVYLRKERFDIFHSFYDTSYIYLHMRDRFPTIVQPFGIESFTNPIHKNSNKIKQLYSNLLSRGPLRYCISNADAVASEGSFQNNELLQLGASKDRIFELPIGVNLSFINEKLNKIGLLRKDLGLTDNEFILLSVNRYGRDKGIDDLVDAFNIIKASIKNAKLILIGSVEDNGQDRVYNEIRMRIKLYRLSDSVMQLKNIPEDFLYYYYANSDVYISPTLQDDFIMSIQEAMACGMPIISTGQEFSVIDGFNGFIIPKKNPQSIANAVLRLYDSDEKRKEMGKSSKDLANNYGFDSIAKKAIDAYENLLI